MSDDFVQCGDIKVFYKPELDGGGRTFGKDYVPFLNERVGKTGRVYEWCAGPGFIGFHILSAGLCDTLCLSDINPAAVECVERTIRENDLGDRVTVYRSDCLDDIPRDERWDLVVGNPPHSGLDIELPNWGNAIIYKDIGWDLHRRFYSTIGRHLADDAKIILQENYFCSTPETFAGMIAEAGLQTHSVGMYPPGAQFVYYLWSQAEGRAADGPAKVFSVRDFDFADQSQREAERHFREDSGFSLRPALGRAEDVLRYREIVLTGDLLTRNVLRDRSVVLSFDEADRTGWRIEGADGAVRLSVPDKNAPPANEDCRIDMTESLFVDLYEHRMSLPAAITKGLVRIRGDQGLARVVLCALLSPSGMRLPPGENSR